MKSTALSKILDIALKDLTRSFRSLFLLGMAFAAPLLIALLIYFAFGSMVSGDVSLTPIRVGVMNADQLPPGAPLEAPLGDSVRALFFDESVQSWITAADYADEAAARAAVSAQEIGVAVIIPPDFTAAYLNAQSGAAEGAAQSTAQITLWQDPTLTIAPGVVRDMVVALLDGVAGGGVAYQVIQAQAAAAGQALEPAALPGLFAQYTEWYAAFQRALFHSPETAALAVRTPAVEEGGTTGLQALMGLVLAGQLIFFSFFTGSYAMATILQEAEEGTLPRLFTTPTARTTILAGKFLAVLATVALQGAVLLAAGRLLFGIRWGQPGAVLLALGGQVVAAVGLAVLLVAFIKKSSQAGAIFGGGLTALGMVSGLFTTNIAMPEAFNRLGSFTPQGWVLRAWRLALAGQPPEELVLPFLVLLAMGAGMFWVGAWLFRRRFA